MIQIKKTKHTKCWGHVELDLSHILLLEIGTTTEENWQYIVKFNISLLYDPAPSPLDIHPREKKKYAHQNACIKMCRAATSTIVKIWK